MNKLSKFICCSSLDFYQPCNGMPLCLQDNLWGYRLSLHRGISGAAGTKRGQLLEVKVERYKQPVILN